MRTRMVLLVAAVTLSTTSVEAQVTARWFNEHVRGIALPPQVQIVPETPSVPVLGKVIRGGVEIPTQTQIFRAQKAVADFVVLAPNAGEVWPGNVVQYSGLRSGVLNPVSARLNERVITVDAPGAPQGASMSRRVPAASYGAVHDSLASILRDLPSTLPAQMAYSAHQVYDANHARFALDAGLSWPTGKVNAALETIDSEKRTNVLATFSQTYYTVSVARPQSPAGFIQTGLLQSRNDIRETIGQNNPPAYVASVSYGRRIVISATSTESAEALKAAFQAVAGVVTRGRLELSAEQQRVYRNSEVMVVILGGNPEHAADVIKNPTIEQLAQTIRDGAHYSPTSPGHPLSYTVRYLSNNQVASVGVPAEWSKYTENPPAFRRPFEMTVAGNGFVFLDTADDDEDLDWTIKIEALSQSGQAIGTAFTRSARNRHVYQYGKDRKDPCKNNCFYKRDTLLINEPVFRIRWEITVRTRDGDGKKWGTTRGDIDVNRTGYTITGGNDGEWKLHLVFGPGGAD